MMNVLLRLWILMQSLGAAIALALASLPGYFEETPKVSVFFLGAGCVFTGILLVKRMPKVSVQTMVGDALWGVTFAIMGFAALALVGSFADPRLLFVALCWSGIALACWLARSAYEVQVA